MDYPSIISQEGSADRNYPPILEALRPWINNLHHHQSDTSVGTCTNESQNQRERESTVLNVESQSNPSEENVKEKEKGKWKGKVFEIGSYPYTHLIRFAGEFKEVEWVGSCRDQGEIKGVSERLNTDGEARGRPPNLHDPQMLDIASSSHWNTLRHRTDSITDGRGFDGVLMFNVIHCCPQDLPERVFEQLSLSTRSLSSSSSKPSDSTTKHDHDHKHNHDNHQDQDQIQRHVGPILSENGWIAVYGPYLNDDGTYKSKADEEFDKSYIKAKDPRLGLRSIKSITTYAERWGFKEVERKEMPKGNMWVVWQRRPTPAVRL